jgi:hypothetical protein
MFAVCIFGACVERIDLSDETWIDETRGRGKNETNVPPADFGIFATDFHLSR